MEQCKNCNTLLQGKFCYNCGQKKFTLSDLSVKKYFVGAFKDFTHFDFKLFRDIPRLVFKPGFLTKEYVEGKVNKHIKPITMFVWINVFFFLYGYQAVLPQDKFQAGNIYWPHIQQKALAVAAKRNIKPADYIEQFNRHLVGFEKYLFFIIIPAFAFIMFLLYIYQKNNYYVKHFVYSIHFWCYFFIYFAFAPVIFNMLNHLYRLVTGNLMFRHYDGPYFMILLLVCIVPYTFFALRRVFNEHILLTILKTVLVSVIIWTIRVAGISMGYYFAYLTT